MPPITLPGNTLEGGGQLLRLSLSLSSLLSLSIHIPLIRAGRSTPGLKSQHLTCVTALTHFTNATTTGATKKSTEITFSPVSNTSWHTNSPITIDIGTPGSIAMILQAVLPYLIFAPGDARVVELKLIGGTNVSHSPSVEYLQQVLLPTLNTHVLRSRPPLHLSVSRRSWTIGSSKDPLGEVTVSIPTLPAGAVIPAFEMKTRGEITKVVASVIVPGAEAARFRKRLEGEDFGVPFEVGVEEDSGHAKRYYLLLVAHTSGGYRLGRDVLYDSHVHRKKAKELSVVEYMVRTCTEELKKEVEGGGCVDELMQDQMVVFQALARGRSTVLGRGEGSLHTRTARWVAERIAGVEWGGEGRGEVEGVGLRAGGLEWGADGKKGL